MLLVLPHLWHPKIVKCPLESKITLIRNTGIITSASQIWEEMFFKNCHDSTLPVSMSLCSLVLQLFPSCGGLDFSTLNLGRIHDLPRMQQKGCCFYSKPRVNSSSPFSLPPPPPPPPFPPPLLFFFFGDTGIWTIHSVGTLMRQCELGLDCWRMTATQLSQSSISDNSWALDYLPASHRHTNEII